MDIRLAILEQENALLRLEKEWVQEREAFLVRTHSGMREPRKEDGDGRFTVGVLGGLLVILVMAATRNWIPGVFVGGFALLFGVFQGIYYLNKANTFEAAQRAYEASRSEAIEHLQLLRGESEQAI